MSSVWPERNFIVLRRHTSSAGNQWPPHDRQHQQCIPIVAISAQVQVVDITYWV